MTEGTTRTLGLRDAVELWKWTHKYHEQPRCKTQDARVEIEKKLGDVRLREPDSAALDPLRSTVHRRWLKNGTLGDLPPKALKRTPWILFYPPKMDTSWLGAKPDFSEAYIRWIKERPTASVIASLVTVFLKAYPTGIPTFQLWRETASELMEEHRSVRLKRWRERAQLGMLARDGPKLLAENWITANTNSQDFLTHLGLTGILGDAVFLQHVVGAVLERLGFRLGEKLTNTEWLSRVLSLLSEDGKLRFEQSRRPICETLLLPFANQTPEPDVQGVVQQFLLQHVGDPRIAGGKWQGVDDRARSVMFRWLVAASLEDFFRVLDRSALDRMWRQRKKFWSAYLDEGVISDAWVIFGRNAMHMARQILEHGGASAGLLKGGGDMSQSVLLMRIGGLTVAEWSHNSKCCFWREGNEETPKPYQTSYLRRELMDRSNPDLAVRHAGSWYSRCASFVYRETGIRHPRVWGTRW